MSLKEIVHKLVTEGPANIAPASGRRVRALFNGVFVLDTIEPVHVWEHIYYPQYYVPLSAIEGHHGVTTEKGKPIEEHGTKVAQILRITVGSKSTDEAVYFEDIDACGKVRGLVKVFFGAMDQWYEEDTPIYVHPKDPTKRIDILPSSRAVEVRVDGHVLAKTTSSWHLIEPLLPVRYYLPPTSVVDPAILRASKTRSLCPYKGEAEYYDVVVGGKTYPDLIWWYRYPTHESSVIVGALCFYNEKVDVFLDGKQLDRPKSKFA